MGARFDVRNVLAYSLTGYQHGCMRSLPALGFLGVLALAGCARIAEPITGVLVPEVHGVTAAGYDAARFHRIALHVEPWPSRWELRSDLAGSLRAVFTAELVRKGYVVISADDLPADPATALPLDRPADERPLPVRLAAKVQADAVLVVALTDLAVIRHQSGTDRETLDLQVGISARLIAPVTSATMWSASYTGNHFLAGIGREQDVLIPITTGLAQAVPAHQKGSP